MKSHEDLIVYQKSLDFVVSIYKIANTFPKNEIFGLASQITRAAVSIPSNISEGAGSQTKKEFLQFLYIAQGSANEVDTQLEIALRLRYIENKQDIYQELISIKRMLANLIKSCKVQNVTSDK
jgi:S23 ribosomal protein.